MHDRLRFVLPLKGEKFIPEQHDHGEDGAELNDYVEHLLEGVALLQGQECVREDQMPGAGNRKPFRDAFHDAEKNNFKDFRNIHE